MGNSQLLLKRYRRKKGLQEQENIISTKDVKPPAAVAGRSFDDDSAGAEQQIIKEQEKMITEDDAEPNLLRISGGVVVEEEEVKERIDEVIFCKNLGEFGKDISRLFQNDKIFISYAWEETGLTKKHANKLEYYLKLAGSKNVIYDGDTNGSNTLPSLLEHVESSNTIILLITPTLNQKLNDLANKHVIRDEVNIITQKLANSEWKGQIIPILLKGTQESLPNTHPLWKDLVYEDFTSVFESKMLADQDYYDKIFDLLERLFQSNPLAKPLVDARRNAFRVEVKEVLQLLNNNNNSSIQRQVFGDDLPILSNFLYGREETIEKCRKILKENKRLVLSGMAGVGKTLIGLNLIKIMTNYQTIWFIDTKDNEIELVDIYKRIVCDDLKIQMDEKEMDIPGRLERTLRNAAKQSKTSVLIVFENVDHDELRTRVEEEFLLKNISDNVSVMIMTRCQEDLGTTNYVMKIPLLDDEDAIRLLFHYSSKELYSEPLMNQTLERCKENISKLSRSEYNVLKRLAVELLEKHPLGITLVGSAKRELYSSWEDLESKWVDLITQTEKYSLSSKDPKRLVGPSIQLSIEHLNVDQRELLHKISFWGSRGTDVPLTWVGGIEGSKLSGFTSLKRLNLVQELVLGEQTARVSCHSLVVECVWNYLKSTEQIKCANDCLEFALKDNIALFSIESGKQRVSCISSLVIEKTRTSDHGLLNQYSFSSLLKKYGDLAYDYGMYRAGIPISRLALDIGKKAFGEENVEVATNLNRLVRLLSAQGNYEEAQIFNREALRINIKTLGNDHPNTITSRALEGNLLKDQGRYDEALPLLKEVVDARKRVLGDDHPSTATALHSLAQLLNLKGEYFEAEKLVRQAMVIDEKALGSDHVNFGTRLVTLGDQLDAQGKFDEALSCYERGLVVYKKTLGEDHSFVAATLNNIAASLKAQGKFEEAERYFEEAIAILKKALGESHPSVATTFNNIALSLEAQGKFEEAERYYEQSLGIRKNALGEDHPDVATGLNNLACLLRDQGKDVERARKLGKQSYAIALKTLGEDHPDTIDSKYWETF